MPPPEIHMALITSSRSLLKCPLCSVTPFWRGLYILHTCLTLHLYPALIFAVVLYFTDLSSLLTVLHQNGRSERGVAFVLLQLHSQRENGWQVAIEWVSGGTTPRQGGQSPFVELLPLTDTD